jgi:hypothetical protein
MKFYNLRIMSITTVNTNVPFPLAKVYKEDTGQSIENWELWGRITRYNELIIEDIDDSPALVRFINKNKFICVYDYDYVKWLEEKVQESLKIN